MNPQSATMPAAPRIVNDVAGPSPVPAPMQSSSVAKPPAAAPAPVQAADVPSGPNIVTNIPVHAPQAETKPASEDDELDKIMHDVGQELKKTEQKTPHHGLLGFLHHDPKPLVKVNSPAAKPEAPIAPVAAPAVASIPAAPIATPVAAAQPQVQSAGQTQPQAVPAKTKSHVPFFAIFVAICVTGFLVAAAVAAYQQS